MSLSGTFAYIAETVATTSPFDDDQARHGDVVADREVVARRRCCQYVAFVSTGTAVTATPMSKPSRPRARAGSTGVA